MADVPSFSSLTLPADLNAEDVIGVRDQIRARIELVVQAKGKKAKKKEDDELKLPEGVLPIEALPEHIAQPWQRFDVGVTELQEFRDSRAMAQADELHAADDETEKGAANADADDRWRAFEKWNGGAAGLAEDGAEPSPAEARWLHTQLFAPPVGLRFITYRPRAQWTAMQQRMKVLEDDRAKAVIEGFGGARHKAHLDAAHARFGKAFGFTAAVIEPVGGPTDGRPQWVTAREGLRTLVLKIETYADPGIAGSEALAAFLLGPYTEMVTDMERSRRARGKKAAPEPGKPEPGPGTPPQ